MSKGYAAVKWREGHDKTKPVSVDTWYVSANPDDGMMTHPAGMVVTFDLGRGKHAQVVFTRQDLLHMLQRYDLRADTQ